MSGLLLAVSGGPDSLALLHLAALWRDAGAKVSLDVATVDHGLRADSAAEAEWVATAAAALGLSHRTLVWRGDKPTSGLQEQARAARYALLFEHARKIGAQAVVTAHHADDQWETILFRLSRGSGLAGLAGMAREQIFPDGRILRPLLDTPKQALIDFCRARGQTFCTDPSNANAAYARGQMRALAAPLQDFGLTREKLIKFAARAGKADSALDWTAESLLKQAVLTPDCYDLAPLEQAPAALFERVLLKILTFAAGAPPNRLERLEKLAEMLQAALRRGEGLRATLGGCVVTLNGPKKTLRLRRENERRRGFGLKA